MEHTSVIHTPTPTVEIKDFNVLIDGKAFFDILIENKE